jgi:carbamoyl-phosphate synthase large subunit
MSGRRKLTVAVTGLNARADNPGPGLAVVRCLQLTSEYDLRIVGLSYDALDPGLYHPWCDTAHLLPYPSTGQAALLDRLQFIHAAEHIDILIPCLDAELPVMVALEADLHAMGIRMLLPTAEQLQARDKSRLGELAARAEVNYPETRILSHPGFFSTCHLEGWSYPYVVKGPFYDASIVHDAVEAGHAFRRLSAAWGLPILAQKLVPGSEVNLTGVGDGEGHLLGTVMMKKRGLTEKGKAWAGMCIHDEGLEAMANRLVAALKWRGPLEVEAMRDGMGQYHLIEINPRFPAWIFLSAGVGRNLPLLLLKRLLGEPQDELPQAAAGTLFIRYAQELIVPVQGFETMMIHGTYPAVSA